MTRPMYYDRMGQPMTMMEWATKFEDFEYKVIKQETVGEFWISTVWLGLDHGFNGEDPLIFETMVFKKGVSYKEGVDQRRYTTLTEAMIGHEKMVKLYGNK